MNNIKTNITNDAITTTDKTEKNEKIKYIIYLQSSYQYQIKQHKNDNNVFEMKRIYSDNITINKIIIIIKSVVDFIIR